MAEDTGVARPEFLLRSVYGDSIGPYFDATACRENESQPAMIAQLIALAPEPRPLPVKRYYACHWDTGIQQKSETKFKNKLV